MYGKGDTRKENHLQFAEVRPLILILMTKVAYLFKIVIRWCHAIGIHFRYLNLGIFHYMLLYAYNESRLCYR